MNSQFLTPPTCSSRPVPCRLFPWLSDHLLDPGAPVQCCLGAFAIALATAWNALPPGLQAANSFWVSDLLWHLPDRPSLITSSESPPSPVALGFPGGTRGKEPTCQCRRCKRLGFDPWVRKIPWRSNGNPLQYSCLENPIEEPSRLQSMRSHRVQHD